MPVLDFRKYLSDLRNHLHYLDSCLFVEHDGDPDRNRILLLRKSGAVVFVLSKSVKDEVDAPSTPLAAKDKATGIPFTFSVRPSSDEERKKLLVEAIIIGNGRRDKYLPDATHVVEAGAHHAYFITTDIRVLRKKDELKVACSARVVTPAEWLAIWDEQQKSHH